MFNVELQMLIKGEKKKTWEESMVQELLLSLERLQLYFALTFSSDFLTLPTDEPSIHGLENIPEGRGMLGPGRGHNDKLDETQP